MVVVASWGIAFVEYCFAVPANRWGHTVYSAAELKTMQEVITLSVFAAFSVLYLGERITLNHIVGFALICSRRLLRLPRAVADLNLTLVHSSLCQEPRPTRRAGLRKIHVPPG